MIYCSERPALSLREYGNTKSMKKSSDIHNEDKAAFSSGSPEQADSLPVAPVRESEVDKSEPNEALFGVILIFCLIVSLIAATGYFGLAGYRYFKRVQAEKAIPSIEALPKAEVAEPVPETSAPVEKEVTTPPAPSPEVVAVDKKTLSIKILNGGAAKGLAGTYAEKLKAAGFSKTIVGNAFGDYAGQTLYYAKGQSAGADAIKAEVMKSYPSLIVKEAPAGDKDASAATYVLILGR